MKLSLLLETVQDQIAELANKQSISPEEVKRITKAISQKQWKYVLNQWYQGNIRLPEDSHRIKDTLAQFEEHKNLLTNKDTNQYKRLSDIESAINTALGKKEELHTANLNIPGVKIVNKAREYTTVEVSEADSLKILGEGTKWCTRESYPDCQAEAYLNKYDYINIIFKDKKPFIQYTPDYSQIMDVNDNKIEDNELLQSFIPKPINPSPARAYNYAKYILDDRWPEAEPIIMKDPRYATLYQIKMSGWLWKDRGLVQS